MATTEQKTFKKKRLFKVQRELNVSQDRILQFLDEQGYDDALKGKGLNASIVDEEAYMRLREEYADDAAAASRVKELRSQSADEESDRHEVASLDDEAEAAEATEAEAVEAVEAETEETGDVEAVEEEDAAEEVEEAVAEAPDVAEDEELQEEEKPVAVDDADEAPVAVEAEDAQAEPVAKAEDAVAATDGETPAAEDDEEGEEEDVTATEAVADEAEEAIADEEVAEEEPQPVEASAAVEDEVAEQDEEEDEEEEETVKAEEDEEDEEPDEDAEDLVDEEEEYDEEYDEDEEEDEDEEVAADGTLKADRYRLKGTSVVGQLDLSKVKRRRRKRKRKSKSKSKREKQEEKQRQKQSKKSKKKKKKKGQKPDEKDVEEQMQETLRELEQGASRVRQRRRQRRRERHARERERERQREKERESILRVSEFISTGELANLMDEPVHEVIQTLFEAGMMVSINQRLDADTIQFIADEYDYDVEFATDYTEEDLIIEDDDPEDLETRAPVVTVMGHVDHGKTSLLDFIRNENVVAGEAGGITQHIGAHHVQVKGGRSLTFLDTPGHEAFTAMRARGAQATDIVILVVAADDSVMPQTREAINHAQAADVPIVVAINKMDLPEADEQKVMAQLAEENVIVEPYGGQVQCALVSAETGQGIDDLLEKVALEAELHEIQANPDRMAIGTVIESRLEQGRGNVITVLVQNGTLSVGDPFVAGIYSGRVRAMFDERDNRIDEVGPSRPALILGTNGAPEVGDQFVALEDEGFAREVAQGRQQIHREQKLRQKKHITLDEIGRRLALGEFHELNLIIKGDVGGSVEALSDSLLKLTTEEVAVNVVHSGVGAITESDVMLASASDAVIIGFQVRPTSGARTLATNEEIDIRTYSIIYAAIEDVHDALEGLLSPEEKEETVGQAEVRDIFKVPKVGTVAGCYVTDGKIHRNDNIRVVRDGVVVYEGNIGSLKRIKDDVREVQSGYECGLSVENFDDIKVGDELETYKIIEIKRTLEA